MNSFYYYYHYHLLLLLIGHFLEHYEECVQWPQILISAAISVVDIST